MRLKSTDIVYIRMLYLHNVLLHYIVLRLSNIYKKNYCYRKRSLEYLKVLSYSMQPNGS